MRPGSRRALKGDFQITLPRRLVKLKIKMFTAIYSHLQQLTANGVPKQDLFQARGDFLTGRLETNEAGFE
jgi:hypothetical protein